MGQIDDYLRERDGKTRDAIAAAYAIARELAPSAEDGLKYGMPCLVVDGKGLISVMATAKHIGVYPFSSAVVAEVGAVDGLRGATKGALQFPLDEAIPDETVRLIVRARLREIGR